MKQSENRRENNPHEMILSLSGPENFYVTLNYFHIFLRWIPEGNYTESCQRWWCKIRCSRMDFHNSNLFSGKISNFFIDVQTRSENCDHPHSNRIPSAWHRSFLYPLERLRKQLGLFWQPVRTGCGINKLPEVQESASDQVAIVSDSLGLCFIVSGSIIEGKKKQKIEDSLRTSKETNLRRAVHCIPLDTHKCSYRIV